MFAMCKWGGRTNIVCSHADLICLGFCYGTDVAGAYYYLTRLACNYLLGEFTYAYGTSDATAHIRLEVGIPNNRNFLHLMLCYCFRNSI